MKRLLLVVSLTLAIAAPAFAQSLPDRSAEVKQLVEGKYQSLLTGDDDRGRIVLGLICNDLNKLDGGLWGELIKNDRNPPFVPYDHLVWKPTGEHLDILSGRNPSWGNDGPIPSAWAWLPCPAATPDVTPPPPVVGVPPPVAVNAVLPVALDIQRLANAIYAKQVADDLAAQQRSDALSAQLKAHDENPSWVKKLIASPYFQIGATAFATWMTTQQLLSKPAPAATTP